METPTRSGGQDQPPVGRPQGERKSVPGQDGQEANGGSRKATGKRGQVTGPFTHGRPRITGRIPGPVPGPARASHGGTRPMPSFARSNGVRSMAHSAIAMN